MQKLAMTALETPIFSAPEEIGWTRKRVEDFGEEVATALGYHPGDDLEALVQAIGGTLVYEDVESAAETGSIEVRGCGDFTINISPYSAGSRTRFTIAHELGHYFMHSQMGARRIAVQRDGTGRVEWEANWFAAGFLMPTAKFLNRVAQKFTDAELAMEFGVSGAAARIRRSTLVS